MVLHHLASRDHSGVDVDDRRDVAIVDREIKLRFAAAERHHLYVVYPRVQLRQVEGVQPIPTRQQLALVLL